ncbi:MAG: lipopolysaccharide heptosyltransferase II [Elusimicrobia bacterium RIFOXYA2_FULL_39_19]|nr:MAG: lipopolysaccharide heptosyltransferase II [Elusimicrobia bacterium RIFOXYA2_FULL_39_19]
MKNNILIFKLSSIGDILMATPSFSAIRKTNPDSKIVILTGLWSKEIIINNPNIDEIIAIDENIFWNKRIFQIIKLYFKLKSYNFQKVYQMHWSPFFNLFFKLLAIPERTGFNRNNKGFFLTKTVDYTEGKKNITTIQSYIKLADNEYLKYPDNPQIFLTQEETSWAKNFLAKHNIKPSCILGVAPGGGKNPKTFMPSKRWPIEYFTKLSQMIANKNDCFLIVFGGDSDKDLSANITKHIANTNLINLTGQLSLKQTAALMAHCKLVISNDSGLLHLAIASGTKTVSIFGPTSPYDKFPKNDNNTFFFKAAECSPCYVNGNFPNCIDHSCMKQILPEAVFSKVEGML